MYYRESLGWRRAAITAVLGIVVSIPLLFAARAALAVTYGYCTYTSPQLEIPPCSQVSGYPTDYVNRGVVNDEYCCTAGQCYNSGGLWAGTSSSSYTLWENPDTSVKCFKDESQDGPCCGQWLGNP